MARGCSTVFDYGKNRMVHAPTKKHGGRFGGSNEQNIGKAARPGTYRKSSDAMKKQGQAIAD